MTKADQIHAIYLCEKIFNQHPIATGCRKCNNCDLTRCDVERDSHFVEQTVDGISIIIFFFRLEVDGPIKTVVIERQV